MGTSYLFKKNLFNNLSHGLLENYFTAISHHLPIIIINNFDFEWVKLYCGRLNFPQKDIIQEEDINQYLMSIVDPSGWPDEPQINWYRFMQTWWC